MTPKDIQKAREAFDRSENWSEWVADHEAAIIKALDRAIQEQGADYVLVPREPTVDINDEIDDLLSEDDFAGLAAVLKAAEQASPDVVGEKAFAKAHEKGELKYWNDITGKMETVPVEAGDEIKPFLFGVTFHKNDANGRLETDMRHGVMMARSEEEALGKAIDQFQKKDTHLGCKSVMPLDLSPYTRTPPEGIEEEFRTRLSALWNNNMEMSLLDFNNLMDRVVEVVNIFRPRANDNAMMEGK